MRNGKRPTLAKDWQWRKFGDCAQFINGRAYSQEELLDEGTPVLRIQNLNGGDRWYYSNLKLPQEKYCEAGDLLYAWSASFGPYRFTGPKSIFHYHIWRVIPGEELDKTFAFHLLEEITAEVKSAAHGVAMLHMTKGGIEAWPIPLPPLAEQRRIAEVLDRAEALRAKRRAALAQLDSLTQSLFLDLFGDPVRNEKSWPIKPLGDLVAEFRYGSSNKSANQGKPALRIPNVADGTIDLANLKLVPVDAAEFERLRLLDGDLLFVRTNGNPDFVGRCAVFDSMTAATSGFAGNEFIFASYLIRARLAATNIAPVFLREYLLGDEGRRQLRSRSKTSAGQFNINTESLGAIPVPLPPIPLQREFARRVTAVEALKTAQRASLAELDALFATLQNRAFKGEL